MNNRESLSHLVEIQYLLREKNTLLSSIEEENDRISALEKRQAEALRQIELLDNENRLMGLKEKELTLSTLDTNIVKLKSQLNMASNEKEAKGLNDTLKNQEEEKNKLESQLFLSMEIEEKNTNTITDLKNFLNGLTKTKEEISAEVEIHTGELKNKLANTEARLLSLKNELAKDALLVFERALLKHPKNPLSYISNLACKECRMHLNSVLKTQVENMASIEPCPYCERILLPSNLNY